MNYRTTVTLAVLVAIGAIVWLGVVLLQPTPPTSDTIVFLEESLNKDDLTFIEVKGENPVKLTRGEDGKWSLQGNWPVRDYAVASLVEIITRLDSRFSPIMVEEDGLEKYGLDKDGLKVLIKINDNEHTLLFGEAEDNDNQFSRPTYLRLNDNEEILRLAPNLIAQLARPAEYYMQRRLFQYERAKKDEESDLTEEKLLAKSIQLKAEDKKFTLARADGKWQLAKPVVDRLDPDKVDTLLTAFPDIWAEKFYDQGDKDLSHFGLGDSAKQISVTQTDGKKISLMVGDVSRMETKKEPIPSPPPRFPGAPQPPPQFKDVEIPYYYARLKDNDQIFDVRGKILEKILVKSAELRDPQVARFDTDDVQKLEIQRDKARIVITRKKENWFLEHPFKKPAEGSDVRSLLSELSNAQVETEEIIDNANLKEYGLDSPAVVKLFLEEDKGGEEKTKVKKELVFRLGKKDADKKKVYLQLAKWSRIDPVDVSLLESIQKPAISFRKRQLFDFSPSDLKEIQVAHQKESFTLGLNNSDWELSAPVKTDVDDEKAKELADDLSRLEVVEFVTDKASKKDLQEKYGLAKANLSVKVAFKEKDKRAETLVIGNPREKEEDKKDDKDKKSEKDKKED